MKANSIAGFVKYINTKYNSFSLNFLTNIVIGFFILIAVSLIMAVAYFQTLSQIKQNFKEAGNIVLDDTADKINSRLNLVENTISMISNDSRILNPNSLPEGTRESEINRYLINCIDFNKYDIKQEGLAYTQNFIDDIIFINDNFTVVARRLHFTTYNIYKQLDNPWFKKALENKGKSIWTNYFYNKTAEEFFRDNSKELNSRLNQFMLIRYVVNPYNSQNIGYLAASINLENLSRLIDNVKFSKHGSLYIIDENARIIASEDRSQLLKAINFDENTTNTIISSNSNNNFMEGIIGDGQYFIFYSPLSINNWKLIITIPVEEFRNSISTLLISVIGAGLATFVFVTLISTLIVSSVSNPLKKILVSVKAIRAGNLSQRVDVHGCLEVNELSTEFNFMLDKINELLDQIVEEQNALRKSELKAFRAQINPHFLYNTLDSIKWLVLSGDTDKASSLISSLSTFFRIGLSGGREEINISEEVEHVRQYLSIQKIRCEDKLDYIIDVDSEVEGCKTPKLILQPIVENAIFHGLNKKEGHGFIKIRVAKKDYSSIVYEITDNGIGMTCEELTTLNELIKNPLLQSTAGNHGYAMRNVNQRLKLHYGEKYGIVYKSKYNAGTLVSVTIPIITDTAVKASSLSGSL